MAKKKEVILAKHKYNSGIGVREFSKESWLKGGTWKKDYVEVKEPGVVGKATKKESKPETTTGKDVDEELVALKEQYLEVIGKKVAPSKSKDKEWIKGKIQDVLDASSEEE